MPVGLNDRPLIKPILSLGYLALLWMPIVLGWVSGNEKVLEGMAATKRGLRDVVRGDTIGFVGGLGLSLLVILIAVGVAAGGSDVTQPSAPVEVD